MALHRLAAVTMGVPNVSETYAYYSEFGLIPETDGWLATRDGGRQLRIVAAPMRQLLAMQLGADDPDDIERIARGLTNIGATVEIETHRVSAVEPVTGVRITAVVMHRVVQRAVGAAVLINRPGQLDRIGRRAEGVLRSGPVRPRKLGHAVLGTTDFERTKRYFVEGFGFKISDLIADRGAFLRCSTDHHNVLVLAAPVSFLHHTSWQVDDLDEVGRGASAMLEADPARHVWGLGRHHAGSNFFWYLKDPAGTFSEYYSDLDCIIDDQLWTPEVFEGARGLFNWGPPPPPSFLNPDDLGALMANAHKH